MNSTLTTTVSKVPAITAGFWLIKILATTLGETGGDAVSMTLGLGYLIGSAIFGVVTLALVSGQIRARSFIPALYWAVVVATTTFGTTLADFADRSLGLGYAGGVTLLFCAVIASLVVWRAVMGRIESDHIVAPKVELFYWITIMFSQTLGTALGDMVADTTGLGYRLGALVFAAGLVAVALLYFFTGASRKILFWAAFILTRPLGATLGDFLDKPLAHGGLALGRFEISGLLVVAMMVAIAAVPQRPARAVPG